MEAGLDLKLVKDSGARHLKQGQAHQVWVSPTLQACQTIPLHLPLRLRSRPLTRPTLKFSEAFRSMSRSKVGTPGYHSKDMTHCLQSVSSTIAQSIEHHTMHALHG